MDAICKRARLWTRFVKGHGFSRATRGQKELGFTGCGKTPAWQYMCEGARLPGVPSDRSSSLGWLESCHKLFKMREWGFSPCNARADSTPEVPFFRSPFSLCGMCSGEPVNRRKILPHLGTNRSSYLSRLDIYGRFNHRGLIRPFPSSQATDVVTMKAFPTEFRQHWFASKGKADVLSRYPPS